jgi:hypothetical protein
MNTSIVAEVRLQLEGLSHTQEEERKEGESDHVIAIYKRLERAAAIIHPLQNHLQVPRTQQQHAAPKDPAMLENEYRLDVALLAQEKRRAQEALQVQEKALTRLQEQVQILESQVQEAQRLAQAHEILIRSDPAIYRDLQMVMGVGKSATKNSSSVASCSMEGSMRDDSSLNVRGKRRKQRKNDSRFLSRFQASPRQRRNSKSSILGPTINKNKPVSDDAEYGDTCSLLSTSESIADRSQSQCRSRLSLGGASKGGLRKPRTEDDDGQGMSYAIPNFLPYPSSITTTTTTARPARTISILKRDPLEQIPVDTRRKSWKRLPVPDLNQNQMGNRSTRSVNSRCSGSSSISSDDDSCYSSQSCCSSLADGVPASDGVPRTPTRIRFESVQTRLYHQTLGDNPAVKYGPPIALDWEYEEMSPVQVDEHEETRRDRISISDSNKNNHKENKPMLSSMDRRRVLKSKGFTEEEIDQASQQAEKAKKERATTNALLPAMKVEEVLQSTRRHVMRFLKKSKHQPKRTSSLFRLRKGAT